MKFSLRSLVILSLIIFLIAIVHYERNRANRLAMQIDRLEAPLTEAIQKQEWLIRKQELALLYAKDSLRTQMESEQIMLYEKLFGDTVGLSGPSNTALGHRRELANIRNAQLKLSREKAKLEGLNNELMEHRAKIGQ